MRKVIFAGLVAFAVAGAVSPVKAQCIGSGSFQTCTDTSGNSYTINRMGNSTFMNGYNSRTGSTWSQDSTTIGGTTFHNGQTNGRSWNSIENNVGGQRFINGTDSRGNSFSKTCNQFGCF